MRTSRDQRRVKDDGEETQSRRERLSILYIVGPLLERPEDQSGNGVHVIAVKKLDGTTMHLNEDLIERVADGAEGQSAIYFRDGAHIIVANDAGDVVEFIRAEKVAHLLRVLGGPPAPSQPSISAITKLTGVRTP